MRIARPLLLVVPLLVALACGGRVQGVAGQCPAAETIAQGGGCQPEAQSCPASYSSCPGSGGGPVTIDCTCQGGQWQCAGGVGCQPAVCPSPSAVVQGAACSIDLTVACPSPHEMTGCDGRLLGPIMCSCAAGAWSCEQVGTPLCPLDAGIDATRDADAGPDTSAGCPPATVIAQGQACASPGLLCPGNPTLCNGIVDYDAFECQNGQWIDVARTACDVDSGPVDAGPCGNGSGFQVPGFDGGGTNVACEQCLQTNYPTAACQCAGDPNLVLVAGQPVPACEAYDTCVYLAVARGGVGALTAALASCATTAGGQVIPPSSVTLGRTLIGDLAAMCGTGICVP